MDWVNTMYKRLKAMQKSKKKRKNNSNVVRFKGGESLWREANNISSSEKDDLCCQHGCRFV